MIVCMMMLSAGISRAAAGWTLPRIAAVGFSIGDKGYIGTGAALFKNQQIELADFWEYNPSTDSWTQKANFGGGTRGHAVGFSIGTKGYIGTGQKGTTVWCKDFWEYNPATNKWTKKADFGGVGRKGAIGISINGKGYIGTGGNPGSSFVCLKDFWEYNPATDKWVQIADLPGLERFLATGFSIGAKGYVGTGLKFVGSTETWLNDFYEYDPQTDVWTSKAVFGGIARNAATGFSIGSKGYIGAGNYDNGYLKDFWEYNAETDTWAQVADFAGGERSTPPGFSIGTKGYVGTGWNANHEYQKDFWEFNPVTNAWTQKADLGTTRKVRTKTADANVVLYQESGTELRVFPNPSSSTFNFRLETMSKESAEIKIYDLSGKLVQKYNSLSPGSTMTIG